MHYYHIAEKCKSENKQNKKQKNTAISWNVFSWKFSQLTLESLYFKK